MRCTICGMELGTGGCANYSCPTNRNYVPASRGNPANDIINNKTVIPELERENHRLSAENAKLREALTDIVEYSSRWDEAEIIIADLKEIAKEALK